ncbi:MAG: hypothetical protein ACXABO_14425 [Promethearchaeota archaeon]|jgi:hypothetical protein
MKNPEMEEKRKSFVKQLFEEVQQVPAYSYFYSNAFNVVAKLGLLLKAKKEELFTKYDWSNPALREFLLEKTHEFLDRHTK